jgi:hypothetical protein
MPGPKNRRKKGSSKKGMPSRTRLIVLDDATFTTLGAAFSAMSAMDACVPEVSA